MNAPNEQRFSLPYGSGELEFRAPTAWTLVHATPLPVAKTLSIERAARDAIASPIDGSPPLSSLAHGARTVTLVITDATRPCPDSVFVPILLEALESAGVSRDRITVLIGLGMHRPTTNAERRERLGRAYGTVRLEDAQGSCEADYVDLGALTSEDVAGLPVSVPVGIHRRVVEADLVIATGVVEPHQYAGFSGGAKTVAIGCAAEKTIRTLHGIPFLELAEKQLGTIQNNPMQGALLAIGQRAGLRFVVNVARSPEGGAISVAAGSPSSVHAHLSRELAPYTWTPVGDAPFDAAFVGIGAPKDVNVYQASRALTYLAFLPRPVLRPGAWVVLAAACPEGVGEGHGELEFHARMSEAKTPAGVVSALRECGFGAGGQRAFMVARALENLRCAVVGAQNPRPLLSCHLHVWATPEEAVERLAGQLPDNPRILVAPRGLGTLPTPD